MSLNNISLPSHLIADLYQHVLVQGTASAVPVKQKVPFLGKNEKNILIVVNQTEAPFLPDHELSFLTNVLLACQLGLTDVAIVNWNNTNGNDASDCIEQLKSKHVILFDVPPGAFAVSKNFRHYVVARDNEQQFVAAPSLTEIEKNKEAKKTAMACVKTIVWHLTILHENHLRHQQPAQG